MPDQGLVADLGDEQVDGDASLHGGGDGVEHRLVRHEVRARDDDALLGVVEQGEEETQVVLAGEARTARHDLALEQARVVDGLEGLDLLLEQFVGLDEPVGDEDEVQRVDDGAVDAGAPAPAT